MCHKKDTFHLTYDNATKIAYVLKKCDEMTKNHQESNNPIVTGFMPQILNLDGIVYHVHSYENYTAHLNEKCDYL